MARPTYFSSFQAGMMTESVGSLITCRPSGSLGGGRRWHAGRVSYKGRRASFASGFLGFVNQHHRDAVADGITQTALRIGADDLLAFEFHIRFALRARQDFE